MRTFDFGYVATDADIAEFPKTDDRLVAVSRLRSGNPCFILRSGGHFTFARVAKHNEDSLVVRVDAAGSTKTIPSRSCAKYIRLVKQDCEGGNSGSRVCSDDPLSRSSAEEVTGSQQNSGTWHSLHRQDSGGGTRRSFRRHARQRHEIHGSSLRKVHSSAHQQHQANERTPGFQARSHQHQRPMLHRRTRFSEPRSECNYENDATFSSNEQERCSRDRKPSAHPGTPKTPSPTCHKPSHAKRTLTLNDILSKSNSMQSPKPDSDVLSLFDTKSETLDHKDGLSVESTTAQQQQQAWRRSVPRSQEDHPPALHRPSPTSITEMFDYMNLKDVPRPPFLPGRGAHGKPREMGKRTCWESVKSH